MIPQNKEHLNAWFIRELIKDYENRPGFTIKQSMEDDGLHVKIKGPFRNRKVKEMEFSDL